MNTVDSKSQRDLTKQRQVIVDVFGVMSEPMCNYYRCHHKFSEHGSNICRCKHPRNRIIAVEKSYNHISNSK
jgi:endonuclease III